MKNYILAFLSLFLVSCSLTVLFMAMRFLMQVGGVCAEGGPYVIEVHCPKGIGYLMPLAIWIGMIAGFGYFRYISFLKNSPKWWYFFWNALFMSLGWNFLEFALNPPGHEGIAYDWLICGIVFELMALAPLFIVDRKTLFTLFTGSKMNSEINQEAMTVPKLYESRIFLLLLHFLVAAGGIFLGMHIINLV